MWMLGGLALTSCRLEVDYGDSMYACQVSSECPDEQACVAGFCQTVTNDLSDAAPADAVDRPDGGPAPADATPSADAAWPPNLLADPSFENSEDDWFGDFASVSRSEVKPHTGVRSLFVCKHDSNQQSMFGVHREIIALEPDQLPVGARFHAEIWVRASQSLSQPAPQTIRAVVREMGGPAPARAHEGAPLAPVTLDWLLLTVDATVTDPGRDHLALRIETGSEPDNSCFALEDGYIGRLP